MRRAAAIAACWVAVAYGAALAEPPMPSDGAGCAVRVENRRFFLPYGRHALGAVVPAVCRAVGARLVAEDGMLNADVETELSGCTAEVALARLLAGVSHAIVWRRDPSDGAGTNWVPAEVRLGRSMDSSAPDPVTPRPLDLPFSADVADLAAMVMNRATDPAARLAAARALARIGTGEAAGVLLDALAIPDPGETERDSAAIVASELADASAAPVLAARALMDGHPLAQAAAMSALARLADGHMLAELESAHRAAPESREYDLVLEMVRRCACPAAEPQLHTWADEIQTAPGSPRAAAALRGLASLGTGPAVDSLLQRLSDSPPADRSPALIAALGCVAPTPEGLASLRFAAEGNRIARDDGARLTAMDSLARFPDAATIGLLRRLADHDAAPAVRERAAHHLRRILGHSAE